MALFITSSLRKNIPSLPDANSDNLSSFIDSYIQSESDKIISLIAILETRIATLEKQKHRCADIAALLEEAGGISVRTRNFVINPKDADKYRDKTKAEEILFQGVLDRLDKMVQESVDDGVNLLKGESLTTNFDTTPIITTGIPVDSKSLGIRTPDFSNFINVQNSRIDVMNAMDMVVTLRNTIASDITTLSTRLEFAKESLDSAKSAQESLSKPETPKEISVLDKKIDAYFSSADSLAEPAQQETFAALAAIPQLPPVKED